MTATPCHHREEDAKPCQEWEIPSARIGPGVRQRAAEGHIQRAALVHAKRAEHATLRIEGRPKCRCWPIAPAGPPLPRPERGPGGSAGAASAVAEPAVVGDVHDQTGASIAWTTAAGKDCLVADERRHRRQARNCEQRPRPRPLANPPRIRASCSRPIASRRPCNGRYSPPGQGGSCRTASPPGPLRQARAVNCRSPCAGAEGRRRHSPRAARPR